MSLLTVTVCLRPLLILPAPLPLGPDAGRVRGKYPRYFALTTNRSPQAISLQNRRCGLSDEYGMTEIVQVYQLENFTGRISREPYGLMVLMECLRITSTISQAGFSRDSAKIIPIEHSFPIVHCCTEWQSLLSVYI